MRKLILSAVAALAVSAGAAHAAGTAVEIPKQDWSWNGMFGKFDQAQLRRGFQIYNDICAGCHSLNLLAYRNLAALGFSGDEIKEIAAQKEVPAPPNEWGEIVEDGALRMQPAKASDRFVAPYANEKAARAMNNGALPPDLSLMTKARKNGPDYLYALLTGYKDEAPEGVELMPGMYYNEVFPGHQIAMVQPLYEEMVEYSDGTPATLEQEAKDITAFLAWAAEPELEERKSMGLKVLLFLIVLTAMLYAVKRKIWADVH